MKKLEEYLKIIRKNLSKHFNNVTIEIEDKKVKNFYKEILDNKKYVDFNKKSLID